MPQQQQFIDPSGVVSSYSWPVNPPPDGMPQPAGKRLQIDRTSNTGNVGATKQQGEDGPYIIHQEPLIYHTAHEDALWQWYKISKAHSIHFVDFDGQRYEGQIITCEKQEIGANGGPGDTNARLFYCKFIFEFEVWNFISGTLADAGIIA